MGQRRKGGWASPALSTLLLLITIQNTYGEERGASLTLKAKWRASPYIHEAVELVVRDQGQGSGTSTQAAAPENLPAASRSSHKPCSPAPRPSLSSPQG